MTGHLLAIDLDQLPDSLLRIPNHVTVGVAS